jgi:hypothetical protein
VSADAPDQGHRLNDILRAANAVVKPLFDSVSDLPPDDAIRENPLLDLKANFKVGASDDRLDELANALLSKRRWLALA